MRLALRILGTEVLAIEIDTSPAGEPEETDGPPFGFSGSGGGQIERADGWPPDEVTDHGRRP
ncbi:hypothetical protein [Thermomonospora cellulosilytica]|uniref:Uncharacterized protein n=1 Tax=Thermomonospora cellulosilytica TaxID=1411118 RepID=A0A7W3R8K7_9ACTN|nr:hypothetical protein [Thermomonospora cellulosilytica]MBA9003674.1 hypothetical protein [Thermomonospora cellulosilytica]